MESIISIKINKKDDVTNYVNTLLKSCLKDKADQKYIRLNIFHYMNDYFKEHILEDHDNHFVVSFGLKREDLDINVSTIMTYIRFNKGKIYLGLHSKTREKYEGRKYNQILRSIFIIFSKYIRINDKPVDYVGSFTTNPISAYIWEEKFGLIPVNPKIKVLTDRYLNKFIGGKRIKSDEKYKSRRNKIYEKLRKKKIIKKKLNTDEEIIDYMENEFDEDIIAHYGNKLKQFKDWNYKVDRNDDIEMNYIAEVTDKLIKSAWEHLTKLLTKKIGKCTRNDIKN